VTREGGESSTAASRAGQEGAIGATPAISPRAWLWAAILEGIGYAAAFVIGLIVLESFPAALIGCGIVAGLFVLWVVLAVRRASERAPTSLDPPHS
jgi:hypothetical protein